MPTRTELQDLSKLRIEEAESLYAAGLHAGAYYLAGYSLELALKACICRLLNLPTYPESEFRGNFKTHRWQDLVLLAGLQAELAQMRLDGDFEAKWSVASSWTPEDRYQIRRSGEDAFALIDAVRSKNKGVLTWLSSRW